MLKVVYLGLEVLSSSVYLEQLEYSLPLLVSSFDVSLKYVLGNFGMI